MSEGIEILLNDKLPDKDENASEFSYYLPPENKFMRLSRAVIEAGETIPSPKDGQIAQELYRYGLECIIGEEISGDSGSDSFIVFLRTSEVQHIINRYQKSGQPIYLGPSAALDDEMLSVLCSDDGSTGYGLWTARRDRVVDYSRIDAIRLTEEMPDNN